MRLRSSVGLTRALRNGAATVADGRFGDGAGPPATGRGTTKTVTRTRSETALPLLIR